MRTVDLQATVDPVSDHIYTDQNPAVQLALTVMEILTQVTNPFHVRGSV